MAIEGSIQSVLAATVSGRCYPMVAPDNTDRPYITFQVVSNVPEVSLDGPSGQSRRLVQVDVWGESYASAKGIEQQVAAAMAAATAFKSIPLMSRDLYEDEVKIYRVNMEFSVWNI
ncbi:MAG: DUF3168 domain-containing protein [Thermodesulfobacteriota bacterium]|jgi:hypothetical protein